MTRPGRKDDGGKARFDLIPTSALTALAQVLTFGATKYSPGNWKHVPGARRRYQAALFRHLVAYLAGQRADPESGLSHLAHVLACAAFLVDFEARLEKTRDRKKAPEKT